MATKNKKIKKNLMIVDLTDATCAADVYAAVAYAKMQKVCSTVEINSFVNDITCHAAPTIVVCTSWGCKCQQKKPNVFKRFWNWITRKK